MTRPKSEQIAPADVRRRRATMGLTAEQLADMAGIGEAEVLLLERGTLTDISPGAWDAICSALRLGAANGHNPSPPLAGGQKARRARTARIKAGDLPTIAPTWETRAPWWAQLRLQRRILCASIKDVAMHAHVSERRVIAMERGSYPATSEHLDCYQQLCAALAMHPPELPVLAPSSANWTGYAVGSRAERGFKIASSLAAASAPGTPAGELLRKRLANGWSRQRAAGVIGSRPDDVEAEEVRQAWPLRQSPAMRRLSALWRVPPPWKWCTGGEGSVMRARTAAGEIVKRATAICDQWQFDSETLCIYADLSPMNLDAFLSRDLSDGKRFWAVVASLTDCGLDILSGLTLNKSAWEVAQEGRSDAESFDEIATKTEKPETAPPDFHETDAKT